MSGSYQKEIARCEWRIGDVTIKQVQEIISLVIVTDDGKSNTGIRMCIVITKDVSQKLSKERKIL